MGLLAGIGVLRSLLPIAVFLYLVTFSFSHSMSLWKKNVEMGLSHVGDREQTLVGKKNLQPGAPKPESNFPWNQDLYLQLER